MTSNRRLRIIISVLFICCLTVSALSFASRSAAAPRTYDFTDKTNNKAYQGSDSNQPPVSGPEIGTEVNPSAYNNITYLDGLRAEYGDVQSDYHRFRFKVFEPLGGDFYVEHYGSGSVYPSGQPFGLRLFIWNYVTAKWELLGQHDSGTSDGLAKGARSLSKTYVDTNGFLHLLAQTKENTGSCPFLYTYDGQKYVFVADLYGNGIVESAARRFAIVPFPEDYVKIGGNQLQPSGGLYTLRVAQEYDEISYFDKAVLMTVDHLPSVDVYPSLLKTETGKIYTVSKNLTAPVSAVLENGGDVLDQILREDDVCISGQGQEVTVQLNLGDLSAARNIKLVVTGNTKWVPGAGASTGTNSTSSGWTNRFVEVKNQNGGWISVLGARDFAFPAAMPRTYVLDLTGRFTSSDYSVKLTCKSGVRIDCVAVDTSAQEEIRVGKLSATYGDLHHRGYSYLKGSLAMPDYYDFDPTVPSSFSRPRGNFTRFGDVLPLLSNSDDKFVIMHHGDEISLEYDYVPVEDGWERDFFFHAWGYYKNRFYGTGGTVEPLPFYGMSSYPYPAGESYPYDTDHLTYLREYNTRNYGESGADTESTHHTIYTNYVRLVVSSTGVGGVMVSTNTLAVLAPYLVMIGLVATAAIAVRKRRN